MLLEEIADRSHVLFVLFRQWQHFENYSTVS